MGAGNPQGVVTNGQKIEGILGSFADVSARDGIPADMSYTAQTICDALGVDPEGEWKSADE